MPDAGSTHPSGQPWSDVLDALETHIGEVRAGLATGVMPAPYEVVVPSSGLPVELSARARRVLASHHDVEDELRTRLAGIASALVRAGSAPAPVPVYVDRRD